MHKYISYTIQIITFAEIRKIIATMSKAQLKKHLSALNKEQIIEVMLELYDARKEAKEYLEFYLNPNEDEKLEEYKRIIRLAWQT